MKKSITSVLAALGIFLSAFLTSSAMAGSFGMGVIGAGGHFNTTGQETEGGGDLEVTKAEEEANGLYASLFAEYTWGEMYGITLGASYTPMGAVLGSRSRTDAQHAAQARDANLTSVDKGTYTAKAKISNHLTFYIEPTYMPTESFGLYLKGGVAQVTVNSLEAIGIGEDSSAYGDESVRGVLYGFGVKGQYDSGLFTKLEVMRIMYDSVKMVATTGNKNTIEAEPEQLAVKFGIGWKF